MWRQTLQGEKEVCAMGVCQIVHSLGSQVLEKLERGGLTPALANQIVEDRGDLAARMVALVSGGGIETPPAAVVAVPSIIRIVDGNTRLVRVPVNHDDRILAFPGVGWATEDKRESRIADRTGTVEEEIILRCFGRDMSSEDVIAALAKETAFGEDGLEPVSSEELRDLLKLTRHDPNLPTPIAALGVSWRSPGGDRGVPCLRGGSGRRYLDLYWFGLGWYDYWWFAARRKSKP